MSLRAGVTGANFQPHHDYRNPNVIAVCGFGRAERSSFKETLF